MPPSCSICTSKHRSAINKALREGIPYRDIEKQYGVSPSASTRHKQNCTTKVVAQLQQHRVAEDAAETFDFIAETKKIYERATRLLDEAEASTTQPQLQDDGSGYGGGGVGGEAPPLPAKDWRAIASTFKEMRESLKLIGLASGAISTGPSVNIVMAHPGVEAFVGAIGRHLVAALCDKFGRDDGLAMAAEIMAGIEAEQVEAKRVGVGGGGGRLGR